MASIIEAMSGCCHTLRPMTTPVAPAWSPAVIWAISADGSSCLAPPSSTIGRPHTAIASTAAGPTAGTFRMSAPSSTAMRAP